MSKNNFSNPLDNIKIASPCSADWNKMVGDERQRHCAECKLNVYNLSGMSRRAAENLLIEAEGRVCVRYFKRADGTVITKDCPVGWKAVKRRVSKIAAAFASLIFTAVGGIGLTSYFSQANEYPLMGEIAVAENSEPQKTSEIHLNSNVSVEPELIEIMGDVSIDPEYTMGEVSKIDRVKDEILENQD